MKGKLIISRPQGRDEVRMTVIDQLSGDHFLEVEMNLTEFARALFAQAERPCEFELRPALVGLEYQHKIEFVPHPRLPYVSERNYREAAAEHLAPFETDGWIGDSADLFNHHRHVEGGSNVNFRRWVKPADAEDQTGEEG